LSTGQSGEKYPSSNLPGLSFINEFPAQLRLGLELCGYFEHLGQAVARDNILLNLFPAYLIERNPAGADILPNFPRNLPV
jgi:hypothetical protein